MLHRLRFLRRTFFSVGNGSSGPGYRFRGLIKFDLGLIPNNAIINSATLYLRQTQASSYSTRSCVAYPVTQDWTSPMWNTSPTITGTGASSFTITSSADQTIDLKSCVKYWVEQGGANFGIMFIDSDETAMSSARSFASVEHATASYRPTLTIDYTIPTTGKKQVEYVGSRLTNGASNTSFSPLIPTVAQAGDLLIAQIGYTNTTTVSIPSGWTQQVVTPSSGYTEKLLIATKFMAQGESAPTFSSSQAATWAGVIYAFRNVKSINDKQSTNYSTGGGCFGFI